MMWLPPQIYIFTPEGGVLKVVEVLSLMHIIHAHTKPNRDILLPAPINPYLIRINPFVMQDFGIGWPPMIGGYSICRIPDCFACLTTKARPAGIRAYE